MLKCPFGFLELLFIYSCVCVYFRCFYISLLMIALDEILVNIPVCLGTRQLFELLEDSISMTSCLVFLPHLFYGFLVGLRPCFFPKRRQLGGRPVFYSICWSLSIFEFCPYGDCLTTSDRQLFSFGLDDCRLCRSFGLRAVI